MIEATICNVRDTDLALIPPADEVPRPLLANALFALFDRGDFGVRDAAMNIWGICQLTAAGRWREFGGSAPWSLRSLACLFAYGSGYLNGDNDKHRVPDPRRPIHIMNIDALVVSWIPIIRGLCVGHDKAEIDRCEYESQEHLTPLLSCRVTQLREFFDKLCTALRSDPTIPLFVHAMFDAYNDGVVKQASDQKIKGLKTALATEIADMVEERVRPDLKAAMVGALQWRGEKELTTVRDAVKSGATPRVRGRESCLFLEVEGTPACVML